jgi:hypothetical protein
MTTRFRWLAAMLVWGCVATACQAQFNPRFGAGAPGPAVSPYLNLQRGGNPAINYYGLVRPQVAAARAFESLGNDVANLEASSQVVQTGIRSSFMTQGRYFMNNGAVGAPRTNAGATSPATGTAPRRR